MASRPPKRAADTALARLLAGSQRVLRFDPPEEIADVLRAAVQARDAGKLITVADVLAYLKTEHDLHISRTAIDNWCVRALKRKSFASP